MGLLEELVGRDGHYDLARLEFHKRGERKHRDIGHAAEQTG